MAVIFQENSQGASVNSLIDKLTEIDWYHNAGLQDVNVEAQIEQFLSQLNVEKYEFKWVNKDKLIDEIGNLTFQDSKLWEKLKDLPDQLKEKIDANNLNPELERLVDIIPEAVFHPAFDGAFKQFGEEKVISFLTGNAMYLALMICTSELAGEQDLFKPLLQVIENGHVPVGVEGNIIYLI